MSEWWQHAYKGGPMVKVAGFPRPLGRIQSVRTWEAASSGRGLARTATLAIRQVDVASTSMPTESSGNWCMARFRPVPRSIMCAAQRDASTLSICSSNRRSGNTCATIHLRSGVITKTVTPTLEAKRSAGHVAGRRNTPVTTPIRSSVPRRSRELSPIRGGKRKP